MYGVLIAFHVIACILLIAIILVQAGRGGGLVENLSGVESIFGTKTSAFLTKTTTILASIFLVTCLSLAIFSAHRSRSLMRSMPGKKVSLPEQTKDLPKAPAVEQKPDSPKI